MTRPGLCPGPTRLCLGSGRTLPLHPGEALPLHTGGVLLLHLARGSAPAPRRSLAPAPCVRLCLYNPAESCSCTTRKALPLQSAKGLHPLYSGPIKHKRIILSAGIILLSFIGFEQNPKRSFHILQKLHILILSSVTTTCNGQMVDIW